MIRLLDIILEQSQAAQQADQMGLVNKGWGRWADPQTGVITHKTVRGVLTPVGGTANQSRAPKTAQTLGQLAQKKNINPSQLGRGANPSKNDEAYEDILRKWDGEGESMYGPPADDAPEIELSPDTIITGRPQDIESLSGDDLVDGNQPVDEEYTETVRSAIADNIKSSIMGIRFIMQSLDKWVGEYSDDGKKRFMEYAIARGLDSARLNTPIARGIDMDERLLDDFMADFEIGGTVTFPEPYSFTTRGDIVDQFAGSSKRGQVGSGRVSVYIRVHPQDDGTHSGVHVPTVVKAYNDMYPDNARPLHGIEKGVEAEQEILSRPDTTYEVMGIARSSQTAQAGNNDEYKVIIIDLKESGQMTEKKKTPKVVNKVVQAYLKRPLLPKKDSK